MELVGEEKKIQTLFSELRLADERTAPSFSATWNRAQARALRPRRAFNLSFAAATALLICALVSLAWWSRHWQRTRQPNVVAIAPSGVVPDLKPSEVAPASKVSPTPSGSEPKKPASAEHRFEVSARLRAQTLNGDVSSDFPLTVQGSVSHRRLSGTIGKSDGAGQLELSTVNGSIHLRSGHSGHSD